MTIRHVATAGNDTTGTGSTGAPYKTIAKAMSLCAAGDTILVNGGDVFRETVTVGVNSLTVGSYGAGRATVTGADVVTGWATATAPRYSVSLTTQPNQVFVGSARATKGGSATTLNNGEWFWASSVLYIRSDAGNPDTLGLVIEASQRAYCVDSNSKTGLRLVGMQCQRSNDPTYGNILLHGSGTLNGCVVDDCVSTDAFMNGIFLNHVSTLGTFTNNTITNNGMHGITYNPTAVFTNQTIIGNTFTGNGWQTLVPWPCGVIGWIGSGEIAYNTFDQNGSGGNSFSAHAIYSTGNVAPGGTLLIHHNIIGNQQQGSGIKVMNDATLSWNIVHDCPFGGLQINGTGTNAVTVLMHHNITYNCGVSGGAGVTIVKGTGAMTVRGYHNTFYHNSTGSSAGEVDVESDLTLFDWRNNILVAQGSSTRCIRLATQTGTVTIDSNDYFGGDPNTPFVYGGAFKSFTAWKAQAFAPDAHALAADPKLVRP